MQKVAIFGNTGAGKSTLSRYLAQKTGLPLVTLDLIEYSPGGAPVPHEEYLSAHAGVLEQDTWIIDGFGSVPSAWQRFEAADTLVYLDLPLAVHAWWVTKRFFKGLLRTPEGWPEGSPMWKSTVRSYRTIWLCHQKLTPRYRKAVDEYKTKKTVFHLRSPGDIRRFMELV
ncbi:adenylate kinase [Ruegeria sp. HKCCD4884]|uniref:isopentenyl transferase family protein n=1 Tax=Ruegeria sp. HKCCD4884 TaxID=2683022 RepID=UPI001491BFBB|nr:isopentenyl transferase family protein [Ruegeria sp. HKCCD4884]NOD95235.1 adenylate kinase [Ruegeria sp. HKCCD4884]